MKQVLFILLSFLSLHAFAQTPALEMLIFPKYIEGGIGSQREIRAGLPYVYRARITGLSAGKTYRYANKIAAFAYSNPKYFYILPPGNVIPGTEGYNPGDFYRAPATTEGITNGSGDGYLSAYYGQLTADANGTYTGWFLNESVKSVGTGSTALIVIQLNNPDSSKPEAIAYTLYSPEDQPLTVISMKAAANTAGAPKFGTAIRSTPAVSAIPKNLVFLYDNVEGSGRPVGSAWIEDDGVTSTRQNTNAGLAAFYFDSVNAVKGAWGAIILNSDVNGIRRIEQRSLADASIVGYNTSTDGSWPNGLVKDQTVNTALTTLGGNAAGTLSLVLDGAQVDLGIPKTAQALTFTNNFPAAPKVGDPGFTLAATSSIPDLSAGIAYSVSPSGIFSITGNTVTIVGGGTATIKASHPGNDTYAAASVSKTLTVLKTDQAIDGFADLSKTYGDTAFTLPLNSSAGLPITYTVSDGDAAIIKITANKVTIKGTGTVSMTASQAGDNATNAAPEVTHTLSVAKAPLFIAADNKAMGLGQTVPVLTYTIAGFKYKETTADLSSPIIITTTASATPAEGIYDILVSDAAAANYTITMTNAKLTVYGSAQNISYPAITAKTYGDAPFDPGASSIDVPGNKPVYTSNNTSVALVENGLVRITGAGTAIITATFPASGASFPPATVDQPLSVAKKEAIATALGASRKYGQPDPVFISTYAGLVNGDDASALSTPPSYTTTATIAAPVGSYTITPKDAAAANYTFTYRDGPLSIEKGILTVTAENKTRKYGETNPEFTVVYSGFVNGDTEAALDTKAIATVTVTVSTDAGTYPIYPSGLFAANYEGNYVNGSLVISPATHAVTFDAMPAKKVGDPDFDPSATSSGGDAVQYTSLNTNVATIVGGRIHILGAGNVVIRAVAPAGGNFTNTSSVDRALVVTKSFQTISFGPIPTLTTGGTAYDLGVLSSSGLPVMISSSDSSVATIDGHNILPLGVGSAQISASQAGDANYYPADTVTQQLTITGGKGELLKLKAALSPNGDGINDFLVIDGLKDYPQNRVTIVNRNGVKVYSVEGYDNEVKVFRGLSESGKKLPEGSYFCVIEYTVKGIARRDTGYFILKY